MRVRRLIWQMYPSYLLVTLISILMAAGYAILATYNFYADDTGENLRIRAALFAQRARGNQR